MEEKKHFKLFKAGKKWCTMAIATVAVAAGLTAMATSASADTATPVTTDAQTTQVTNNNQAATSQTSDANQPAKSQVDYQTPVNAGNLDGATAKQGNVEFSGWHATNQYQAGMHHFAIVLDGNTGHELYRHETTTVNRPDVAAVYPKAPIAGQGGFTVDVPTAKIANASSIRLVSRYTNDQFGNPAGGSDYWYPVIPTKAGYLDQFAVNGTKINIAGWHVDDQAASNTRHVIILFDRTKNREIARANVQNVASPDIVKAGYATVANAKNACFNVNFDVTPAMMGDDLAVVSRYTTPNHENTQFSDLWFNSTLKLNNNGNAGYLDDFYIDKANKQVVVSGWNANDNSVIDPVHEVILFDKTANREVGTRQVQATTASPDVARVYGNISNAGQSRFQARFAITPEMLGHDLTVISRYTQQGRDNDAGHYSDFVFNNTLKFAVQQQAFLDTFSLNPRTKTITVAGWHADDASAFMPGHYIILFDKTVNHEITHKLVPTTASPDVENATHLVNSNKARFTTTFNLTPEMLNHTLTIVSRYSNSNNEDYGSATSDYWFNNQINLNAQDGWLDDLNESGNTITASGWHTANSTLGLTHHVILLFDYTTGREVSRHEVSKIASDDLAASHGNYLNYNQARFSTSFTVDPSIANHTFGIISRYSNQADGEGVYSQYSMANRYLNIYQNPGWMYQIQYSQIQANPQEVGHNIGPGYEGVKTWFIKSKLGDANIHNQYTTGDAYAIMNIQRQHGLPATGWVDLPTWRALGYSDDLWYGIDSYVSPTLTNPGATRQQRIDAMINTAYRYMGKPWWAGCSSSPAWGVDCSGLVMQALYGAGINPTTVSSTHHGYPGNEWNSRNLFVDPHFENISWNDRQRGDLVFYYEPGTRTIWHVAILLNPNTVIESWPPSVMVQPILNGQRNIVAGIRRVFA